MPLAKPWYRSKTLWTNLTILVGALSAYFTGTADMAVTAAAVATALLNIGLRFLTSQPVE